MGAAVKPRSRRNLRVEAEDAIIRDRVFGVLAAKDWELVIEIARIIQNDAPVDLALHDPHRFKQLRDGITTCHIKGLGRMSERGIRNTLSRHGINAPAYRWTKADLERMKKSGQVRPGML